ncbi:MAG: hypothetical protein HYT28_01530 [Parcubacteria group bacterium]|nr:hypothetical protein [Parcubacteria group bacterium]
MKKATVVLLAVVFGLFFGLGSVFACGGHDEGKGMGGHEMMTPEGGHMAGCPMHKADGEKATPEAAPAPAPAPSDPGMNHEHMQKDGHVCPHHQAGGEEHGGGHGDGHQCPHHK